MNSMPLFEWNKCRHEPLVVAGPCSVESRAQLVEVTGALCALPQVRLIRCGVWKPRSRPGGFEGLGEQALRWMAETKASAADDKRPRYACEVATPEHVEAVLRHGIDAVWIGARTTANPFMVQELAEALRGTGMSVMVKNAPSPDVRLWMGAIERCLKAGLDDVAAVHRGFDLFHNASFRNLPLWEVPIELRRSMPGLPILCDPSHIAGSREPLPSLSQMAMDLGFDGLMVETHPRPDEALTDADQQLTPAQLSGLISGLLLRQTDTEKADQELRLLRLQIDQADQELLRLLAVRLDVVRQIAEVKSQSNWAVFQPKRWEALLSNRLEAARGLGLCDDFVKELFEKIHAESVRVQEAMMEEKKSAGAQ